MPGFAAECRTRCTVPECVPATTCRPDPAAPGTDCQICHRDHCDGTASVWHTC